MTSLHYLKHGIKIKYAEKIWIFILFSKIQNKDNGKSFKQEKINCNNEDFYDAVDSSPGICLHCSLLATSCFSLTGPMTYSPSALAAAAQIVGSQFAKSLAWNLQLVAKRGTRTGQSQELNGQMGSFSCQELDEACELITFEQEF